MRYLFSFPILIFNLYKNICRHNWVHTTEKVKYHTYLASHWILKQHNTVTNLEIDTHVRYCDKCFRKQKLRNRLNGGFTWDEYSNLTTSQMRDKKLKKIGI